MSRRTFETIVSPITGTQPAAIAVVRLSGPEAFQVARAVFPTLADPPESHRAIYGKLITGDDGLALPFAAGRSYTGEASVELSVHGSPASVRAVIESCVAAGARQAEPGEFTRRAVLNGRMDLTQAEAVDDTIRARTQAQLEQANLQRSGALRDRVRHLRARLVGLLAAVEASVDFSEEVGELDREAAREVLATTAADLERLAQTERLGRLLRQGLRVVIAGPPNAGKSSLFNRLLGHDRVIVTPIPGTTRDTIEEALELDGLPLVLVDTAGLHESSDPVERLGIARTQMELERADQVWYMVDAAVGLNANDEQVLNSLGPRAVLVVNKVDQHPDDPPPKLRPDAVPISVHRGHGLETLLDRARQQFQSHDPAREALLNPRQAPLIRQALQGVELADRAIRSPLPDDLATVGLHQALQALGEVTGEAATEVLLDEIFRNFCIGK